MTEKLYYSDSHMCDFTAKVTDCVPDKNGWRVSLDATAFFPEGGGQAADTGYIGDAHVGDVRLRDGEIWHYTDRPVEPGAALPCRVDREQRYRRMQNHSGEHVVSGVIHALHGLDNVGFHMGAECMTIDLDGELSWDELMEVERRANETVRADLPVRTYFPEASELASLSYRSKLELTEDVRIVEIEGVDRCACCAPHVGRTGEIGLIKILDSMRHRGGVRVSLVCGMDALDCVRVMQENVTAISGLLSARREQTAQAVQRLMEAGTRLKERTVSLSMELARLKAECCPPAVGNLCVFVPELDDAALRELANALAERCGGMAAVFSGGEGAYCYVIVSRHIDLRARAGQINRALDGRGGGSAEMLRGTARAPAELIQKIVENDFV